jgi:hypothetical protein
MLGVTVGIDQRDQMSMLVDVAANVFRGNWS